MFFFIARGHSINEQTPDLFGMPFKFVIAGEGVSLGWSIYHLDLACRCPLSTLRLVQ